MRAQAGDRVRIVGCAEDRGAGDQRIRTRLDGLPRVRAVLTNANEILRPGMFAQVEVQLPEERTVVVLPGTSVVYSPYGDSIYVVAKDDKGTLVAQQRFVKVGPRRGDQISVLEGVKDGEDVVSSGQGKLRPGAPVTVNNTVVPASNPTPKPAES